MIKKATERACECERVSIENELARDAASIWKKKVEATKRSKKINRIGKVAFPIALTIATFMYFIGSYMYQMYL